MEVFFRYSLAVCIIAVAFLEFLQILLRYIFNAPVILLDELLIYPTIWMYFLGCANAAREGSQITANVINTFVRSSRHQVIINAFAMMVSTGISGWLTFWAYEYLMYSLRVWKKTSYAFMPLFFAEASVFVGMAVITWYTFMWFWKESKLVLRGEADTVATGG